MGVLYDTLPETVRARVALDDFDPGMRRWLSTPLPPGYPPERAARLGSQIVQKYDLGSRTIVGRAVARVRQAQAHPVETEADRAGHDALEASLDAENRVTRRTVFNTMFGPGGPSAAATGAATGIHGLDLRPVGQALEGVTSSLQPFSREYAPLAPEPQGIAENVGRIAGQMAPQVAAAMTAAGAVQPAVSAVRAGGAALPAARAAQAALSGAAATQMGAGTAKQRQRRALAGAATSAAMPAVSSAVSNRILKLMGAADYTPERIAVIAQGVYRSLRSEGVAASEAMATAREYTALALNGAAKFAAQARPVQVAGEALSSGTLGGPAFTMAEEGFRHAGLGEPGEAAPTVHDYLSNFGLQAAVSLALGSVGGHGYRAAAPADVLRASRSSTTRLSDVPGQRGAAADRTTVLDALISERGASEAKARAASEASLRAKSEAAQRGRGAARAEVQESARSTAAAAQVATRQREALGEMATALGGTAGDAARAASRSLGAPASGIDAQVSVHEPNPYDGGRTAIASVVERAQAAIESAAEAAGVSIDNLPDAQKAELVTMAGKNVAFMKRLYSRMKRPTPRAPLGPDEVALERKATRDANALLAGRDITLAGRPVRVMRVEVWPWNAADVPSARQAAEAKAAGTGVKRVPRAAVAIAFHDAETGEVGALRFSRMTDLRDAIGPLDLEAMAASRSKPVPPGGRTLPVGRGPSGDEIIPVPERGPGGAQERPAQAAAEPAPDTERAGGVLPGGEDAAVERRSAEAVPRPPQEPAPAPPKPPTEIVTGPLRRAGDISTEHLNLAPEQFQNRTEASDASGVDPSKIQDMLEKSGGKLDANQLEAAPIVYWQDHAGELGEPGTRYVLDGHHRVTVASGKWEKIDGQWKRVGDAATKLPATEFHGTLDEATKYAEDANRQVTPNAFVDDVVRAGKMNAAGDDLKSISRTINKKGTSARTLVDMSHLDKGVLKDVFGGGREGSRKPYGEAMGRVVRDDAEYFTPERQRAYLNRALAGENNGKTPGQTVDAFEHSLDQIKAMRARLKQADLFGDQFSGETPERMARAADKAYGFIVGWEKKVESLRRVPKGEALLSPEGREREVRGREQRMKDPAVIEAVAKIEQLKAKYGGAALMDRVAAEVKAGKSIEQVEADIRKEIDRIVGGEPVPGAPSGSIPTPPEGFVDEVARGRNLERGAVALNLIAPWLWVKHLVDARAARRQATRALGRDNRFQVADNHGNLDAGDRIIHDPDLYSESAMVRALAAVSGGRLPGNVAMTPNQVADRKAADLDHAAYMHKYAEGWRVGLGDAASRIVVGSKASAKVADLMDRAGKMLRESRNEGEVAEAEKRVADMIRAELPAELQHVPHVLMRMYHEMLVDLNEQFAASGMKEWKQLRWYDGPHIIMGQFAEDVNRLLADLMPHDDVVRRGQRARQFYKQRSDDPRFTRDAALQFLTSLEVMSKAYAIRPWLNRVKHDLSLMRAEGDVVRVNAITNWLRGTELRQQSSFEDALDGLARLVIYAKHGARPLEISLGDAARMVGADDKRVAQWKKDGYSRAFSLSKLDAFDLPDGSSDLGPGRAGRRVVLTAGKDVVGTNDITKRLPFRVLDELGINASLTMRKMRKGLPPGVTEEAAREAALQKYRYDVLREEAKPFGLWMRALGMNQMRSVLGYNVPAILQNSLNMVFTGVPEFGFNLGWRRTLAGLSRASERAKQYGTQQGEVVRADDDTEKMVEIGDRARSRISESLGPLAPYQFVEDLNRGMSVVASQVMGQRLGLKALDIPTIPQHGTAESVRLMKAVAKAIRTKGSVERLIAQMDTRVMFDYSSLGDVPILGGGPLGRLLMRLTKFPIQYGLNYAIRPVEGAARTALAALPFAPKAQRVAGEQVGRVVPFVRRTEMRLPTTAGQRYLAERGASLEHQQAAKVFVRQLALIGVAHALTEATDWNWLLMGSPGYDAFFLYVARHAYPQSPLIKRLYQRSAAAGVFNPNRGIVARSPTMQTAVSLYQFSTGDKSPAAAGQAVADLLGYGQIPARVQIARTIQNAAPEAVLLTRWGRWISKAFGVRSVIAHPPEAGPIERAKGAAGLVPADKMENRRVKLKAFDKTNARRGYSTLDEYEQAREVGKQRARRSEVRRRARLKAIQDYREGAQ